MVNADRDPMIRYGVNQLQHFIDFFLSPHVTSDLPFGEKKIKLTTGEIVIVPNTIRNTIPTRIIGQYHLYCEQTSFKHKGGKAEFLIANDLFDWNQVFSPW